MSFNIGKSNSRYVAVSNVVMRFDVSEKVLFADLRTSRKTGNSKVNKETGEVVTDKHGNPIPERVYAYWEGRFVGNALEPAKALKNGQAIDIVNGWMDKETWKGADGKKRERVFVVISDFTLSDSGEGDDDDAPDVEFVGKEIDGVSAVYRSLNGDESTPSTTGEDN